MKKNIGTIDIVIRLLLAALIIVLYFMQVITGILAIILLILAGIFIVTSLLKFCPIYLPFGIHTDYRSKE